MQIERILLVGYFAILIGMAAGQAAAAQLSPRVVRPDPLAPPRLVLAAGPEIRSYQPYSGLQYGFRPTQPRRRALTARPRIIMPKRVAPMIGYGSPPPAASLGYAYCAEPPGDLQPADRPYGPWRVERRQCP